MIHLQAQRRRAAPGRRGNATLVALVAVTVLGGMSTGILALSTASDRETRAATDDIRAQFAAEAGVANALQELSIAFGDPSGRDEAGGAASSGDNAEPVETADPVEDPVAVAEPEPDPEPTDTGGSGGDGGDSWQDFLDWLFGNYGGETGISSAQQSGSTGTGGDGTLASEEQREMSDIDMATLNLGSAVAPMALANSSYFSEITDLGDGLFQILATGMSGDKECRVEVLVQRSESPVYDNALFAGNSSGDNNYTMSLGGTNSQADQVTGDIYSGGNVELNGDAQVNGSIRSYGTITPNIGSESVKLSPPDLAGMDYANTADFDVAAMFSSATYQYDNAGGSAWQMPESSPAHIFRKNPSDRTSDTSGTSKDDYFLEDPYESVRSDSNSDGSDPYWVTVSGQGNEPGISGDNKVYYIDGNLWIHNRSSMSLGIASPDADGTRLTFVVKGNIYFSDNLFYQNDSVDGVAFIALTDENVSDSGNIYFGDPVFGTLEAMEAFMYAENNFYDNNLDASGSATVEVNGNMTAGNHVLINRDYGNQHSRLTVNFDDRISTGGLSMPGLPEADDSTGGFTIVSWREVAID